MARTKKTTEPTADSPQAVESNGRRWRGPSVNRVALLGRLTADAEMRSTSNGLPVTSFRIATNDRETPEFHDVVAWRQLAEIAAKHLHKSTLVYAEGRLHWRAWKADDSVSRRSVEVVADTIQVLAQAVQLAQKGQLDLSAGRLSESPRQTVANYLTAWLEAKRPSIRYKTYVTYRTAIAHAVRYLGNIRLDTLKAIQVEQCELALSAEKGARTVEQVHMVLHAAFRRAVQLDLMSRNPTDAVIAPRPRPSERPSLTLEQARDFFAATRDDRLYPLYVVLTTSGLRLGEALGLQWRYVKWHESSLDIVQSLQQQTGRGLVLEEVKTGKSRRIVPLMRIAIDALKLQVENQQVERVALGSEQQASEFVFTSALGNPLDPNNARKHYYRALAAAGLPKVRLHDLRHTAASLMAAEGIPIHVIQAILGHSNSATTADIYTHVAPASYQDARKRMDAAFERVLQSDHLSRR